jgi:copper oxidase (laccase) domain-containing protein
MKSPGLDYEALLPLRRAFLHEHGIEPTDTTRLNVTYETDNFCRYEMLTDDEQGDGITRDSSMEADALVVTEPNHALFLPLADCVGAVIHDPVKNILMVSHLGRQNLEQMGGTNCIDYLVNHLDVNPRELKVWLSPAAGSENYPLYAFDNRSLHEVASEQLAVAGVQRSNIEVSPIDSSSDLDYFSHSQYLKGARETDGRFAIVAEMR